LSVHFSSVLKRNWEKTKNFARNWQELLRLHALRLVVWRVFDHCESQPYFAFIPSEWMKRPFDLHAQLPHTVRFLRAAEGLLTYPIQGHRELRKPAYRGHLAREPALVGGRPCGPDAQPVSLGTSRHLVIRDPDRMYVEFIQQ